MSLTVHDITQDANLFRRAYPNWPDAEPIRTEDKDAQTWGRRGPFDWGIWEDGGKNYAVHHHASSSLLAFRSSPQDCRDFIDTGGAAEAYGLLLAHAAGEHEAQRNPSCGRC